MPITLVTVGPERNQTIVRTGPRRDAGRDVPRPRPSDRGAVGSWCGRRGPGACHRLDARVRPRCRAGHRRSRQPGYDRCGDRGPDLLAGSGAAWSPSHAPRRWTWSSSAPRRPWSRASPMPSGPRASRSWVRLPRRHGWRRASRSAGRSPQPPACPSPRARRSRTRARRSRRSLRAVVAVVVKADGLAAGKGVTVCDDPSTRRVGGPCRDDRGRLRRGRAARVVLEEPLVGREVSVIALCDETAVLALPAARDHKRLRRRRPGPEHRRHGRDLARGRPGRAGGRGASSTWSIGRSSRSSRGGACRSGASCSRASCSPPDGPRLLECNVRFGDPETQATLPRLAVPLAPLLSREWPMGRWRGPRPPWASPGASCRSCPMRRPRSSSPLVATPMPRSRATRSRASRMRGRPVRWCSPQAWEGMPARWSRQGAGS